MGHPLSPLPPGRLAPLAWACPATRPITCEGHWRPGHWTKLHPPGCPRGGHDQGDWRCPGCDSGLSCGEHCSPLFSAQKGRAWPKPQKHLLCLLVTPNTGIKRLDPPGTQHPAPMAQSHAHPQPGCVKKQGPGGPLSRGRWGAHRGRAGTAGCVSEPQQPGPGPCAWWLLQPSRRAPTRSQGWPLRQGQLDREQGPGDPSTLAPPQGVGTHPSQALLSRLNGHNLPVTHTPALPGSGAAGDVVRPHSSGLHPRPLGLLQGELVSDSETGPAPRHGLGMASSCAWREQRARDSLTSSGPGCHLQNAQGVQGRSQADL